MSRRQRLDSILDMILAGNTTNDHIGQLESVAEGNDATREAVVNLICILVDKGIITEVEVQTQIADSFLWDRYGEE